MKKFTKLFLSLALLLVGVGGNPVKAEMIVTKTPVILTGGKFAECFNPGTYIIQMQGWQNFIAYENAEGVAFDENSTMVFDLDETTEEGSVRVEFTFDDNTTRTEWWCLGIGTSANDESTSYGHAFDESTYWLKKGLAIGWDDIKNKKITKVLVRNWGTENVITFKVNGGTFCGQPMTIKNVNSSVFGAYGGVFTATAAQTNIFKMENFEVGDYQKVVIKFGEAVPSNGNWAYNYQSGVLPPSIPVGATELEIPLDGNNLPELTIFNWNENPDPINISEVYLYKEETIVVVDDPEPNAPEGSTLIKAIDYSTTTTYPYHRMGSPDGSSYDVENGALVISNTKKQTNNWDVQPFIIDNVTLKEGYDYVVRIKMKATANGNAVLPMGTWNKSLNNSFNFTQSYGYSYYDITYNKSTVESTNDIHVLFQCGNFIGTVNIGKVEVFEIAPEDPLLPKKEELKATIALGNAQNSFAKTTDSWNVLTNAIANAQTALTDENATTESLTTAKTAITNAIAGLKLQAGYANLTADMFMTHTSTDAGAAVASKPECTYVLNESKGLAYGENNVGELNWADLTPYEQFIVIASDGTPRFCMNRLEKDGQQAATQEDSKMLDINPNNDYKWSTTKYQTIDNKKFIIDLGEIVKDYGFARLHCIKGANYGNVTATDFLIYAAKSNAKVGTAGYATFSSIMNVDMTGVTAYAAKVNGEKVVLTPVTAVPANNAVIIEAAAGSYNLTNIESAAAIANNDLKVSDGTVAGDGTIYVLANKNDNLGFYKLANGEKVPAGKAYLKTATVESREFIAIDGNATAIKSVETENANDAIYNLAGQQVKNAQKGIFIMNGKKVIK